MSYSASDAEILDVLKGGYVEIKWRITAMLEDTRFQDKFIAFVDILGFKDLVEKAEAAPEGLPKLMALVEKLDSPSRLKTYEEYGPNICPKAPYIHKNLDFKTTQISDCVIISSEISPAGAINIVDYCWGIITRLLEKGILCRGYITQGNVFHEGIKIVGTGYNNAYSSEANVTAFRMEADERGTPFVEIDPDVVSYIDGTSDSCVKKMFGRLTKTDGSVTALFPFQRLSHSFAVEGMFGPLEPEKERKSNNNLRTWIRNFKERILENVDQDNAAAVKKAAYYLAALDEQLRVCDKTDEAIDLFSGQQKNSS